MWDCGCCFFSLYISPFSLFSAFQQYPWQENRSWLKCLCLGLWVRRKNSGCPCSVLPLYPPPSCLLRSSPPPLPSTPLLFTVAPMWGWHQCQLWVVLSLCLSVFSPIAKILGKVGESLTRICCVRPPVERFTFVGKGAGLPFPGPSFFFLTSLNSSANPHLLKFTYWIVTSPPPGGRIRNQGLWETIKSWGWIAHQ